MKLIFRLFFLLLVALLLAKVFLEDSAHPWREQYQFPSTSVDVMDGGLRMIQTAEGVMGTRFVVEVAAPDDRTADRAMNAVWARVYHLEQTLSTWIPDSLLSRVNRQAADGPVPIDEDTLRVLLAARKVWEESDGAFDVTVGPLITVWKPLATLQHLPAEEEIEKARTLVGLDRVELREMPRTVRFRRPGITLDVGGIAKGFAAGEAAAAAVSAGAFGCRVNAGGDMVARGYLPWARDGFPVGVRDPDGGPGDALPGTEFTLSDAAVATSGNYERYTEVDGRRYSHILDPRTGRPVPDAIVQVTVLAKAGDMADAYATGFTVLGVEKGKELAERLPGVEALFLIRDGESLRRVATSGWPGGRR